MHGNKVSNPSKADVNWFYGCAFVAWLFWAFGPSAHTVEWEILALYFVILARIERSDLRTREARTK